MSTTPNVVELFQSQGCSSCPPTNKNIISLLSDPRYLVLTYEVTYWDHLGWKDTFGNSAFDRRQWDYARALGRKSVFTPQVVINGRVDGVGNDAKDLLSLVAQGLQKSEAVVHIEIVDDGILVHGPSGSSAVVQAVRYDPQMTTVSISRGENKGENIPHQNVVKEILLLGTWHGGVQAFALPEIQDKNLKTAILVQDGVGGSVKAASVV